MNKSKLDKHPYREWLIHLAGGNVNKAMEFLKAAKVPLKNVIDMFSYFKGMNDIMKMASEASTKSMNQVEHALPFVNNKKKGGKTSKRNKEAIFLIFQKLVNGGTIKINQSYERNKKKLEDNGLKISSKTYYNYRNEMK